MKYVNFEVAKALKATGYNIPTKAYYRTMIVGKEYIFHETDHLTDYNGLVDPKRDWFSAPTIADAFEWLLKNNINKFPKNFNETHPELLEGEVFLLNLQTKESPFDWIPESCSGGRVGNVAYDNVGRVVEKMYPLFGFLKK
jgi:hypothetical protein